MPPSRTDPAHAFGRWAAFAAAAMAIAYDVPQVLQILGALHEPWDRILIFAPSLLLAPAYVLTTAAVLAVTPQRSRVWSLGALALAILYAGDVSQLYVAQLGSVIPHDLAGRGGEVAWAACCLPHAPTTAVDLLGYTYLSGSTGLMAIGIAGDRPLRRWLRIALIANALLAPLLLGQLAWPWLIYVASPWIVTFPASMILLGAAFRSDDGLFATA